MHITKATCIDIDLKASGIPIHGVGYNTDGSLRVDFKSNATQEQITSGVNYANNFVWDQTINDSYENTNNRGVAKNRLDGKDFYDKLIRAVVLVIRDEINILRAAVVPALSARTIAQVKTAIRNKIDAIDSDNP